MVPTCFLLLLDALSLYFTFRNILLRKHRKTSKQAIVSREHELYD